MTTYTEQYGANFTQEQLDAVYSYLKSIASDSGNIDHLNWSGIAEACGIERRSRGDNLYQTIFLLEEQGRIKRNYIPGMCGIYERSIVA